MNFTSRPKPRKIFTYKLPNIKIYFIYLQDLYVQREFWQQHQPMHLFLHHDKIIKCYLNLVQKGFGSFWGCGGLLRKRHLCFSKVAWYFNTENLMFQLLISVHSPVAPASSHPLGPCPPSSPSPQAGLLRTLVGPSRGQHEVRVVGEGLKIILLNNGRGERGSELNQTSSQIWSATQGPCQF